MTFIKEIYRLALSDVSEFLVSKLCSFHKKNYLEAFLIFLLENFK